MRIWNKSEWEINRAFGFLASFVMSERNMAEFKVQHFQTKNRESFPFFLP